MRYAHGTIIHKVVKKIIIPSIHHRLMCLPNCKQILQQNLKIPRRRFAMSTSPITKEAFCHANSDLRTKHYLFWFSNEHVNFIKAELEALFETFNLDKYYLKDSVSFGPLLILNIPDEKYVHHLLSRSVLIHSCFEIWSSGTSIEEMHTNLRNNLGIAAPYAHSSFRLRIDNYGKKISQSNKINIIETFDYLSFQGMINLTMPDLSLHLIQYYGIDPNCIPETPCAVFFGRWIGDGQRSLISKISLKQRKFIGNTSMDPLLSLLMSNLGLVEKDKLVLDPFVGSGSLLVAAAVMGGYVFGTDIDYLTIHAKTRPSKAFVKKRSHDESIYSNLKQYGVENRYLDVLVADASLPLWKDKFKFDVIITDPPYGVRESMERIGSGKEFCKVPEEHLGKHIPSKVSYTLCDIFSDLIDFSAQRLNIGGRLVCWIPVSRPSYNEDKLPQNPCFKLISNCEQTLTTLAARRLLVFEKIYEPNEMTQTFVDSTDPMYKFKFFDNLNKTRKERKLIAASTLGKSSKKGQLLPDIGNHN